MLLASKDFVAKVTQTGGRILGEVNAAVIAQSGGKLPCYAVQGKRAVKWVSVGSSAVISRSVARDFLARVGVDIDAVETADLLPVSE